MEPGAKTNLLRAAAVVCGVVALGFVVLAFVLIKGGAYPPAGTGSLGHVGMVIAGAIAAFLGILFGGLVFVCTSRIKAIARAFKHG